MSPRFRPWPRRGSRVRMPASLVAVLVLSIVAQIALGTDETTAPARLPIAQESESARDDAALPAVAVPTVLLTRDLFATDQVNSGTEVAPVVPLGGAVVAGSVRVGPRLYAVVQMPGGASGRLPLGGMVRGWRLSRLDDSGAHFTRGMHRLDFPFGTSPLPTDSTEQGDPKP